MKKHVVILPLCLLFISGCGWRSKKVADEKGTVPQAPYENQHGSEEISSLFDANEEAFVLEELNNPFTDHNDEAIELVDAPLWEQDQRIEFETIYFDFDQYKIKPEQKAALERNVAKIKVALAEQGAQLVVEGHACNSAGAPDYNIMLSERRAEAVKKFLVKYGIPADKIKTVGRGSEMRKVQSGNREQQAPNRRVEFYVVYQDRG